MIDTVTERFPHWEKSPEVLFPPLFVTDPEQFLADCRTLRNDPALQFHFLSCISGVDYQDRFEIVYFLCNWEKRWRLGLKVVLDHDRPVIDSVTAIWPTADWHERETYDLVGITFRNHPNLKRIYLPDSFPGHPLRKDFVDIRPKRHRRQRQR